MFNSVYERVAENEAIAGSILNASTPETAMTIALEALGYSNLSGIEIGWDSASGAIGGFDSGYFDGAYVTDATVGISLDSYSEEIMSLYIMANSSGGGGISQSLMDLSDMESNLFRVAAKVASNLDALETAANNTSSLDSVVLDLWNEGVDIGQDLSIGEGEITVNEVVDFDEVRLSDSNIYTTDINITDAIDVLRHIVSLESLESGSSSHHAADVNNDGSVNISDAIDIPRHIVDLEAIDTFDIINSNGNRVTQVNENLSTDVPTWIIVANGDADLNGDFFDDYTQPEII